MQEELANRAIELLHLPDGHEAFILDVGCGSGLSGGLSGTSGHVVGCTRCRRLGANECCCPAF